MKLDLNNGDKLIIEGSLNLYVKGGSYNIVANKIIKDGIGELHKLYESNKIKYETWKYKNKEHIDCIFFIFKRSFMDILDLKDDEWYEPETRERFCKYIYKRKRIMYNE